jgi:arabinogalactan oligomer/maltooligosaccharide transport system substrate-binding protein
MSDREFPLMNRRHRPFTRRVLASSLVGLLIALAAPAAAAATQVILWHSYRGAEKAAIEKVIAQYNASQHAIAVATLAVPYDAFADKISASIPRGKGPDLFIFAQDRLGGWVEAGSIEPIDFFIEEETTASFVANMMPAMTYRGTVYGLPLNYKSIAMIYNTELVKAPPKTTGELVTLAKRLTNAPSGRFGWVYQYSDFYYHASLMNAFGGQVFGAGATPTLDLPANRAAADLMLKWFRKDRVLPANPSSALVGSLFNEGKAAIVFNGPWFVGEIADKLQGKFAIAPLPTVDEAGGKPMRPWLTIEGIYVSAKSAHKESAYAVARHLVSPGAALVLALEGRQLPTNKSVYADPRVMKDAVIAGFRQQLDTAVPMPNLAEMTLMWSPMTTAMNKMVMGSATPEVALAEAQATLAASIAALRKSH